MKFTYSWLKDYVDIKLKPQELADKLTMAGLEIESLQQVDGEWVFEAEVTTNRPDWLSIVGIAREVAAITSSSFKLRHNVILSPKRAKNLTDKLKTDIQVLDAQACPRYTARIINNVKVGPSPEWLQKRLKSIGLRTVNNIVDITNFVLFETGQPLHAFDIDKLSESKIIVRRAKENEDLVLIDGAKVKLNPDMLIIADKTKPVAIAGVMGGKDTEVTGYTKNILLESAYFDPAIIRKASKFFGLSSDSSYRFERGVDYDRVKPASDRAAQLIIELSGGSMSKFTDISKKKNSTIKISVRPKRVNDLLGIEVPVKSIIKILQSLGLKNVSSAKSKLIFSAPSFRRDLKKEIDLIEEIARIYGYDKIPAVQPKNIESCNSVFIPENINLEIAVRDVLISFGLNEAITYSLIDKNNDECNREDSARSRIHLKNPLSRDFAALRTNLISGLFLAARWNLNRNISDVKLFEIGSIYTVWESSPKEENCLGICLLGNRLDNWQDGVKPVDFYYLKGIVEALFAKLGIEYKIVKGPVQGHKFLKDNEFGQILINDKQAGVLGKAKKDILSKFDIEKDCFICQISLDVLLDNVRPCRKFLNLPKFPAINRDISLLIGSEVSSGQIVDLIIKTGTGLVKDVELFDVYAGDKIPKSHKSLAYRLTYQSPEKTLTDSEVESVHSRIMSALKEELHIQIR